MSQDLLKIAYDLGARAALAGLEKTANRLDNALISGDITHRQYLAAGGRTPEIMLQGLRRGSDALVDRLGITEYNNRDEYYSEPVQKKIRKRSLGMRYERPETTDRIVKDLIKEKVGPKAKLMDFMSLGPSALGGGHSLSDSKVIFVDKNPSRTGLERLRGLFGGASKTSRDAPFISELTRRHEIDEVRFRNDKLKLHAHGHSSPRVILEEHSNLRRMPEPVSNFFRRARALSLESPTYSSLSNGDFAYGKSLSGPPNRVAKMIADASPNADTALGLKLNKMRKDPKLFKRLMGLL